MIALRTITVAAAVAVAGFVIAAPAIVSANAQVDEAIALLDDWQLEDARAHAEQLLAKDVEDPQAWLLAGLVEHQRGEHVTALALLNAARDAGVDTGYVHALVADSAAYAAHFESVETPHFSIRYLNKDEIVAHYAAPVLESAYANIGRELEILAAERGEKIVVEIYPNARGLAGATGLTVQEIATSGTIAVCKYHRLMITSPLATANGYAWADTVAHELTHLLVSKKSHNSIPIWLHEGIAKYYESLWKGPAGEALEPFSEKLLADATRKRELISYDTMHPSMAKLPSQEAAALAFAEVFTTIEFLLQRYGKSSIPKVLDLTGQGVPLERALQQVFKLDLKGIEAAWKRYLAKREFHIVPGAKPERITLAADDDARPKEAPLEEIEDRDVHDFSRLGELLQLRGRNEAAVVEYEKAYSRAGVRYPTLAYRLARAYVAVKRPNDAAGVLKAALEVHPTNSDAQLLAGRLSLEQNDVDGARKHYEAVRLENPFNPEIHEALAKVAESKGDKDTATLERRLLDLANKPRPTRSYELPSPPAGNAFLSLVAPRWGEVRIDGNPAVKTPLWDRPIQSGVHTVEYRDAAGALQTREIQIDVGAHLRVVL